MPISRSEAARKRIPPDEIEAALPQMLSLISEEFDQLLQDLTTMRLPFSIIIHPFEGMKKPCINYTANIDRSDAIKGLTMLLSQFHSEQQTKIDKVLDS